jgi:hypothetical protein
MKKNILHSVLLIGFTGFFPYAYAQPENTQSQLTLRRLNTLGTQSSIDQIAPDSKVVGTPYLHDDWNTGTIVISDGQQLENYPLRFDIRLNLFEIKTDPDIKGLPGKKVKEFSLLNKISTEFYVNAGSYTLDGIPVTGFLEVIASGKLTVMKKTELVIRKPDYSVQFNVGSRDTEILKKSTLYYTVGKSLHELPKSNKKMLELFGEHSGQMREFMKVNNLGIKNEADLKAIAVHFNQLK